MASNHLVFLLLALLPLSSSADNFLSIDCGASGTYIDANEIIWTGDENYINGGQSQVVSNSLNYVMDTLRVFTTGIGKRNCYSIPAGKGNKVLIRASFYYGNYDKKSSPPSFELQLNGNYWDTVVTNNDETTYYFDEAIYVTNGGTVSVCLVQKFSGQFPFISALEMRPLNANMYSHAQSNRALYLSWRVSAADSLIRYPEDAYDRLWVTLDPNQMDPSWSKITNPELTLDANGSTADDPPLPALQHAITLTETPWNLTFVIPSLPAKEVPVFINMYFEELDDPNAQLDPTAQNRSFDVYINNKLSVESIVLTYGIVTEWNFDNITSSNTTVFSLVAKSDSTLPPLINALEVFTVSDVLIDNPNSGGSGGSSGSTSGGSGGGSGNGDGNNSSEGGFSTSTKSKKSSKTVPVAVGSAVSGFVFIWACVGVVLIWNYKRKSAAVISGELGENGRAEKNPI